jgi:glycosyltransferase involved in cell wall biosynthesis
MRVLLTTEGTYPAYHGGVTVWCDQLLNALDSVDFDVFALTHRPGLPPVRPAPPNLKSVRQVALWGTPEPGLRDEPFVRTLERREAATPAAIARGFVPPFRTAVREILRGEAAEPEVLGPALLALQRYFDDCDYARSFRSGQAWEAFLDVCLRDRGGADGFTVAEAAQTLRWLARLLAVLAEPLPSADLVHASMAGLAALPGSLAALAQGTPMLLTEHGLFLREMYMSLRQNAAPVRARQFLRSLNRAIGRLNYHYAFLLTALGDYNRRWQLRFGADGRKVRLVPNGVDPARFSADPARRPDRLTVLTMARIYELKGIEHLLEAAAIVLRTAPEVRFRILGEVADPAYFGKCQAIIQRHGIGDSIEFGVTHRPEEAYREAHVFCLPSVSEGMPYSVLEAMFSGCPVAATDVGTVKEMLAGTGLVMPPADPPALARSLLELIAGPGAEARRHDLAARALERARERYTLAACYRQMLELYQEAVACRRLPHHA